MALHITTGSDDVRIFDLVPVFVVGCWENKRTIIIIVHRRIRMPLLGLGSIEVII